MSIIFHITPERDWALARKTGEYRLSTRGVELEVQGFIHCSDVHQVARIANAVYGDFEGGLVTARSLKKEWCSMQRPDSIRRVGNTLDSANLRANNLVEDFFAERVRLCSGCR